jgi:hypothetical protein|tara:strand:- start:2084 stop:2428 length:345 start_codon:yes stop_codon:yes gene_type:complete
MTQPKLHLTDTEFSKLHTLADSHSRTVSLPRTTLANLLMDYSTLYGSIIDPPRRPTEPPPDPNRQPPPPTKPITRSHRIPLPVDATPDELKAERNRRRQEARARRKAAKLSNTS